MERDNDLIVIGERSGWGDPVPFGLRQGERSQHLYVIGQTGTGKSTLLKNLILQDIEAGRGVALIDPHGDLSREIIDHIPKFRTNDVIYFDPTDADPIPLGLFRSSNDWFLAASGVVSAFHHIWDDSWGARMHYILTGTVAALLQVQNSSMLGISRMLYDARYRDWVIRHIHDPIIATFWTREFPEMQRSFRGEATSPIQNKVGLIFFSPHLRRVLGQAVAKVDFRKMMDRKQIFIANLAKGNLGETSVKLLGALLISAFELAALSRVDTNVRPPYHLYCDEFQNYATNSFASVLSESRKYGLHFTLAHQYIEQLGKELSDAVFGNVGSLVAFRVGESDAKVLEQQFGEKYRASQFTGLGNFEVCAKILSADPFFGKTLPPAPRYKGRTDEVKRQSRKRYAIDGAVAEERIRKWMDKRH